MFRSATAVGLTLLTLVVAAPVSANTITYHAFLSGLNEVPANASPATGFATVTFDDVLDTLVVDESFSGLIGGPAAAAHIHCCAPVGVNAIVAVGFPGFPAATSGSYLHTFLLTDISIYTAAYVTAHGGNAAGAEAALIAALNSGNAYVNIHNAAFPGGEIRGQLTAVPEPATVTLLGTGIAAVLARKRRTQRR